MKKIFFLLSLCLCSSFLFAQSDSTILKGSGSDPDGDAITFHWTKSATSPACIIVSPNSPTTTVKNLVAGTYVFTLAVTDIWGATTSSTVTVLVNKNRAPVSNAGPDQHITIP